MDKETRHYLEQKLYRYPSYRQIIKENGHEIEALSQKTPSGIAQIPEGNESSDMVWSNVSKMMLLDDRLRTAQYFKRKIDELMLEISSRQVYIVRMKYFDGRITDKAIARELRVSRRKVYDEVDSVLEKFESKLYKGE